MSSLNDAATYGNVTSAVLSSGDAVRLTGCCTKVRLYRLLSSGLVSMAPEDTTQLLEVNISSGVNDAFSLHIRPQKWIISKLFTMAKL